MYVSLGNVKIFGKQARFIYQNFSCSPMILASDKNIRFKKVQFWVTFTALLNNVLIYLTTKSKFISHLMVGDHVWIETSQKMLDHLGIPFL